MTLIFKLNKMKKIWIFLILVFSIISLSYGFYVSDLKNNYKWDTLNTISVNIDIDWDNWPYNILNTFKSRDEYNLNVSIVWSKLEITINNILKRWFIWFNIRDTNNNIKPYLLSVFPNDTILSNQKSLYIPDFNISWFNNSIFSWSITDSEINDNTIKNTNLTLWNKFISYDWLWYYQLLWNKIFKRNNNFEILNEYNINLWTTGVNLSNITDIKSINWTIFLRFIDGKILKWIPNTSWEYLFTLETYTYSDIWIKDNLLFSPYWINNLDWTLLDYEIIWNYLYILTSTKFELYYIKNWDINNKSIIYGLNNTSSLKSFIINNWIFLFNDSWNLYLINNDFQMYFLKENDKTLTFSANKNFNITTQLKTNTLINTTPWFWIKPVEDIIKNNIQAYKSWIPLYNTENLLLNIKDNDFETINLDKILKVEKFSSNYWLYNTIEKSFTFNIPLIWYWIKFTKSIDNINPSLNYDINNIKFKPYILWSWEYYIHIKAYDYYLNESSEVVKWPIIINNDKPNISSLTLLNNSNYSLNNYVGNFSFLSNKKLEEIQIIIKDNHNNIEQISTNKISSTQDYNGYKYLFDYIINSEAKSINFNIIWYDEAWNFWSIIYDLNLNNWWFQVVWITETNVWISSWLNNNQLDKWFLFWVSSINNLDDKVTTDIEINKLSTQFFKIPFVNIDWNNYLDEKSLKFQFNDLKWKCLKKINSNFFIDNWVFKNNILFLNWYFYSLEWNNDFEEFTYEWNSSIIINWNLNIKWNILKNKFKETPLNSNKLKIYVTWDIYIDSSVNTIEAEIFTEKRLNTLSNN